MWKLRYQVWPRMEEGASVTFKVPPPGIEFTLPSPKIGIESLAVVDPPWSPQVKDKDMEMTLNQERHVSRNSLTQIGELVEGRYLYADIFVKNIYYFIR